MSQGKPCCEPKCELMLISCTAGDEGGWDKGGSRGTKTARNLVWKLLFQWCQDLDLDLNSVFSFGPQQPLHCSPFCGNHIHVSPT